MRPSTARLVCTSGSIGVLANSGRSAFSIGSSTCEKVGDLLRLAVFEHLEIGRGQVRDDVALRVGDDRVELDVVDFGAEDDRGRSDRLLGDQRRGATARTAAATPTWHEAGFYPPADLDGGRRSPIDIHAMAGSRFYTEGLMALDVAAIQQALRTEQLDGWLLYDFHGSNPIASHLAGLDRRRAHDDPALVLPDPAEGHRAAWCTQSSATISTRLPGETSRLRRATGARIGPDGAPGRRSSCGDGIFAGLRHPLPVTRRRGHRRSDPAARRRNRVLRRPGAAVRGRLDP